VTISAASLFAGENPRPTVHRSKKLWGFKFWLKRFDSVAIVVKSRSGNGDLFRRIGSAQRRQIYREKPGG